MGNKMKFKDRLILNEGPQDNVPGK
jgi:hypothetical protein